MNVIFIFSLSKVACCGVRINYHYCVFCILVFRECDCKSNQYHIFVWILDIVFIIFMSITLQYLIKSVSNLTHPEVHRFLNLIRIFCNEVLQTGEDRIYASRHYDYFRKLNCFYKSTTNKSHPFARILELVI